VPLCPKCSGVKVWSRLIQAAELTQRLSESDELICWVIGLSASVIDHKTMKKSHTTYLNSLGAGGCRLNQVAQDMVKGLRSTEE